MAGRNWDEIANTSCELFAKEVIAFVCNEENAENCGECPYNKGYDGYQHRKPCGQLNCWVSLHCE